MKVTLAQPADFAAILELQARFQLATLSEDELAQGFVTTRLDEDVLARMRDQRAIWIARSDDGALAAYACAVEWNFYVDSQFVKAVFSRFPLAFDSKFVTATNSFIYGPACIDERFRGQGLLLRLTEAIRARYVQTRAFGVCFIDVRNARSLAAHERKLGFRRVAELPFADVIYHVLAFETA